MLNTLQKWYGKRVIGSIVVLLLLTLMLAACGTPQSGTTPSNFQRPATTPTPATSVTGTSTPALATPVPTTGVVATPATQNSPSSGPDIILTPTPAPGGGQQVTFPDRVLVIGQTSQLASVGSSTPVSVALTVKNTGAKTIPNEAAFFQLVGSEGDIFGYQSSVTSGFLGPIVPRSSHAGTIVFLVPTAAMSGGLRLLYRSEIDTETVFVALQFS